MKKSVTFLGVLAVLCAGFGHAPAQDHAVPPDPCSDPARYQITLPSREELASDLTEIGEALSRLADAFEITRIPADQTCAAD